MASSAKEAETAGNEKGEGIRGGAWGAGQRDQFFLFKVVGWRRDQKRGRKKKETT